MFRLANIAIEGDLCLRIGEVKVLLEHRKVSGNLHYLALVEIPGRRVYLGVRCCVFKDVNATYPEGDTDIESMVAE